jgi:POT family proton-dependent oligopeptide transporter
MDEFNDKDNGTSTNQAGNETTDNATPGASAAAIGQRQGHPPAIWFFFWGEFAERSSYYGMRTILFLYLTTVLQFPDTTATPIYNGFKMACYFLPLLGGIIADRWLGRYWTIVGFSVPYVLGHFILGIPNHVALFIALALLAGGSGVIKPNISTLMGQTYDEKRPGQKALRSAAFNWFYLAVNVGALVSMVSLPFVRDSHIYNNLTSEARALADLGAQRGEPISNFASQELKEAAYAYAFQFPTWLMVFSLAIFAAGKRTYALETPVRPMLSPEERRLQRQTLWQLFGIFALVVIFWLGYEHNDALWVAFIRDYVDLRVPILDRTIEPDYLLWINAAIVILSIPVFNFLFARFDPKQVVFTPMRKILAGFLLTAASIAIIALAAFLTQGHTEQALRGEKLIEVSTVKVSVLWPIIAYIVLTLGEVLLYGTMLELAYSAAPESMKGFVTACFLMTSSVANFINIGWTPFYGGSLVDPISRRGPLSPGVFFAITAAVTVAAALIFMVVGRRFEAAQNAQAATGA